MVVRGFGHRNRFARLMKLQTANRNVSTRQKRVSRTELYSVSTASTKKTGASNSIVFDPSEEHSSLVQSSTAPSTKSGTDSSSRGGMDPPGKTTQLSQVAIDSIGVDDGKDNKTVSTGRTSIMDSWDTSAPEMESKLEVEKSTSPKIYTFDVESYSNDENAMISSESHFVDDEERGTKNVIDHDNYIWNYDVISDLSESSSEVSDLSDASDVSYASDASDESDLSYASSDASETSDISDVTDPPTDMVVDLSSYVHRVSTNYSLEVGHQKGRAILSDKSLKQRNLAKKSNNDNKNNGLSEDKEPLVWALTTFMSLFGCI